LGRRRGFPAENHDKFSLDSWAALN